MRHLDMGEGVSGRRNSQCKGPEVGSCLVSLRRLKQRDRKGENKEEDHSGHLGPSHPTLGHREEFGFSFK